MPGQFPPAAMRPAEPYFDYKTTVRIGSENPIICMVRYQPDAIVIWEIADPTNVISIEGHAVRFGKARPRDYNVRDHTGYFILSHPSRPGDTLQIDVGLNDLAAGLVAVKSSRSSTQQDRVAELQKAAGK